MHIALVTAGTRGDAQPLALLGLELLRRGHSVVLGVSPNLVEFGARAGLRTFPYGPDTQEFMESPEGQRWLAAGNVRAFMAELAAVSSRTAATSIREIAALVQDADVAVAGILAEDHAQCFSEAAGFPLVTLHNAPVRRTRAYAAPLVTTRALPGPLNRASAALFEQVWARGLRGELTALRAELGLPPDRRTTPARRAAAGSLELQAYSPVLVPGLDDYGPTRPLVGFLMPTPEFKARLGEGTVDPHLDAWLARGEPPVYFGFGSMPVLDPAGTLAMVGRVVARLAVRALVSAGWSRLAASSYLGDDGLVVGALDHDAVLPRCRAAVHHGGAGTTAAAVLAGAPSLVCSVFADQPFWGERLTRLGAGAHLRLAALDEAALERGLVQVMAPAVAQRTAELGAQLRGEADAVSRAADSVEAAGRNG